MVVRLRVTGLEANGFLLSCFRFRALALRLEHQAQGMVSLRVRGPGAQDGLEALGHDPELVTKVGIAWLEAQRRPEVDRGIGDPSLAREEVAEGIVCAGVAR